MTYHVRSQGEAMRTPSFRQMLIGCLAATLASCTFSGSTGDKSGAAELASGDLVHVVRIVKGDELVVRKGHGEATVRVIGIHAFSAEIQDDTTVDMARRSNTFLRDKTLNAEIKLTFDTSPKDVYGRYLAYISVNDLDLGRLLLEQGLAIVYTEFPFARQADYFGAETGARSAKANLWNVADLVTVARGLRQQWQKARSAQAGAPALPDPLLAPASPNL
jgi:micrococcal nuclease